MVKIIKRISNVEIIALLVEMLEKIKGDIQSSDVDYANVLFVEKGVLGKYHFDPFLCIKTKKIKKILWIFPYKAEEISTLIEIETNILEATGRINVTVSDELIYPTAEKEINEFVEIHEEMGIEKIIFIPNFKKVYEVSN